MATYFNYPIHTQAVCYIPSKLEPINLYDGQDLFVYDEESWKDYVENWRRVEVEKLLERKFALRELLDQHTYGIEVNCVPPITYFTLSAQSAFASAPPELPNMQCNRNSLPQYQLKCSNADRAMEIFQDIVKNEIADVENKIELCESIYPDHRVIEVANTFGDLPAPLQKPFYLPADINTSGSSSFSYRIAYTAEAWDSYIEAWRAGRQRTLHDQAAALHRLEAIGVAKAADIIWNSCNRDPDASDRILEDIELGFMCKLYNLPGRVLCVYDGHSPTYTLNYRDSTLAIKSLYDNIPNELRNIETKLRTMDVTYPECTRIIMVSKRDDAI